MRAQRIPKKERNYLAFLEGDALVCFVNMLKKEAEVFIGIGVKPDFCDKHYGRRILMRAYEISKVRYPKKPLYLEHESCKMLRKSRIPHRWSPYELTTGIGSGTFYRMVKE